MRARQRPGAAGDEFAAVGAARAGVMPPPRRRAVPRAAACGAARMTGQQRRADRARPAAGGRGRPPRHRGRRRTQRRHDLMPRSRLRARSPKDANVVLVDLAFAAPNLSVISTDPDAPGIADLIHGTASFGDIITRDQYSRVHLVATGNLGGEAAALAASPMLATVMEALVRSYEHVVLDIGAATEIALRRFAPLAPRAVLVTADPASVATRAARERHGGRRLWRGQLFWSAAPRRWRRKRLSRRARNVRAAAARRAPSTTGPAVA